MIRTIANYKFEKKYQKYKKVLCLLISLVMPLYFFFRKHCRTTTVDRVMIMASRIPVVVPNATGERH